MVALQSRTRLSERSLLWRESETRRVERDLDRARTVQRKLLPAIPPEMPGLRVAVDYCPAFEIGGDFYDLVRIEDGRVFTIVGDVAGNGIAAALLMSRMMAEFRYAIAADSSSPAAVLALMNDRIAELEQEAFVTAACVELSPKSGLIRAANAGHVPPMLRVGPGLVKSLCGSGGPPLGILPGQICRESVAEVGPGSMLIVVTDGVTSAWDAAGRELLEMVRTLSSDRDCTPQRLARQITRITEAAPERDDSTVLVIELTGDHV